MLDTKKSRFFHVLDSFMAPGEVVRNVWCVSPEVETTIDTFLKPETWSHVARKLRKGDKIEVTAFDGAWWAEFLVRSIEGLDVRVGLLRAKQWEAEQLNAAEYEIQWGGQIARARVVRLSDKYVMVEGLASKAAAQDWLDERCGPTEAQQKAA